MTKKIKSAVGNARKKTGLLIKKAKKKGGEVVKSFRKEWKKEQPHREKYGEELKEAARKALEGGVKIGGDVVETIKKDINEIRGHDKKDNK